MILIPVTTPRLEALAGVLERASRRFPFARMIDVHLTLKDQKVIMTFRPCYAPNMGGVAEVPEAISEEQAAGMLADIFSRIAVVRLGQATGRNGKPI